jgi:hypothetical protein
MIPYFNGKKLCVVAHVCHFSDVRNVSRRVEVQASLSRKQDPISKITTTKRAGGVP